jgi:hypothetical protein
MPEPFNCQGHGVLASLVPSVDGKNQSVVGSPAVNDKKYRNHCPEVSIEVTSSVVTEFTLNRCPSFQRTDDDSWQDNPGRKMSSSDETPAQLGHLGSREIFS